MTTHTHRHTRRHTRRLRLAAGTLAAAAVLGLPATAHASGEPTPTGDAAGTDSPLTAEEKVVALVQPGIVYEEVTFSAFVHSDFNEEDIRTKQFRVTFQCTGAVVNADGWIATAGHCVDAADGLAAVEDAAVEWSLDHYYVEGTTYDDAAADLFAYTWDGQDAHIDRVSRGVEVTLPPATTGTAASESLPARIVASTKFGNGDAALLKVEASGLHALPLAEEDPTISTDIVSVGYPAVIDSFTDKDLTPTFNSGQVSSTKTIGGGLLDVYQLSAALSGGMSGGPTVNTDGEVVGLNSSRFDGEQISYAMPIDRIRELMASHGVENTLDPATVDYRDGITALAEGDKSAAVEHLTAVTEAQPTNELAADHLTTATDLPDPAPAVTPAAADEDGSGFPVLPLLVGGSVLLLLVAVAAVVTAVRRRGRTPAPASFGYGPAAQQAPQQANGFQGSGFPVQPAFAGHQAPAAWPPAPTQPVHQPVPQPVPQPGFGFDAPTMTTCTGCGGSQGGAWATCGCRR